MVTVKCTITVGGATLRPVEVRSSMWNPDDPDDGEIAARILAREAMESGVPVGDEDEEADVLIETAAGARWRVRVALGWERTFTAGEANAVQN